MTLIANFRIFFGIIFFSATCNGVMASEIDVSAIDRNYLDTQRIPLPGALIKAYQYHDTAGKHMLVLSRRQSPSKTGKNKSRLERIDLLAINYTWHNGTWHEEWNVKDFVDCPGLDSSGSFHIDHVSFTDLDKNGITEVTLPYRTYCGGAIEPATVKIILRQGKKKLAIRGESLVRIPDGESFGGDIRLDLALEKEGNSVFRKHMMSVWEKVYIDKK